MTKEVWIVVGTVTDTESLHHGEAEYQFCEAPPGKRLYEDDHGRQYFPTFPDKPAPCTPYISLQKGLADHSGYIIHWAGQFKTFKLKVKFTEKREVEGWVSIKAGDLEHARSIVMHGDLSGLHETKNVQAQVRVRSVSDIHEAE
jgi:hypothetical protein